MRRAGIYQPASTCNGPEPHIVHIVGHTEADHAATAGDVIEASQMARPGDRERRARRTGLCAPIRPYNGARKN